MKRFLKVLLIIILILVVVVLVGALFMPKQTILEESLVIKADSEMIFEYINCLEKTATWSPWEGILENSYSGPKCGAGAIQQWKDKSGEGKQEIVESKEFEYVKTFLDFGKQGTANAELRLEPSEGGTKVTWKFESEAAYPIMRWISVLMVKPMLKDSYLKGLNNLDSVIMNLPIKAKTIEEAKLIDVESSTMLSIREMVTMENVGPKMGEFYDKIMQFIGENKLETVGFPVAFWHSYSDVEFDMECAVYVKGDTKGTKLIKSSKSYQGKAVVLDYYGAYDSSPEGWQKINEFIQAGGMEENGIPWDEYITDPTVEADTAKWLTRLYQPVK